MNSQQLFKIFAQCVNDYQHLSGANGDKLAIEKRVDCPLPNRYPEDSLDYLLYKKSHIDNIQWDLEDLIRDPQIQPEAALKLKRRIDVSNQERTDMVEQLDDYFLERYKAVRPKPGARLNTESIAWALDRLSILALKLYHMGVQADRTDAPEAHINKCQRKLSVLQIQKKDLIQAIGELMEDIEQGVRIMKVYRQMKMYNDPNLNPVLYGKKGKQVSQ